MLHFFPYDIGDCSHNFINPHCKRGDWYETAYKWLSQYCNFFPPLFLSSNQAKLIGYSHDSEKVLFGFKNANGFPVCYDEWLKISGVLLNVDTNDFYLMRKLLISGLKDLENIGDYTLSKMGCLENYLRKKAFVRIDQIVVNGLDLRKACVIVCHSDIQKSYLIKKGFPAHIIKKTSSYCKFYSSSDR
jgi:hypothetical protein